MQTTKTIRVMIVDDHDMVRDGLRLMLETCDDLEVAGEARDGGAALMVCEREKPDVILMDLTMPDKDGIEATKEILAKYPDIRIIVLTSFNSPGMVEKSLKAGAISYLKKNVSMDELAEAIRDAYQGKSTLSPEATEELISITVQPPQLGHDLTDREWDVLKLLVKGLHNRQIADQLHISSSTVKHHVSSILKKLCANNRSEAVVVALENDLVD